MREGLFWGMLALAAYGAVSAAAQVAELIGRIRSAAEPVAYVVLVRDQAEWLEDAVLQFAREVDAELVLVDLGSRDESAAVLARLARRLGHVPVLELGHLPREEAIARAVAAAESPRVVVVELGRNLEKEG
ncbi:MAG: hypothetical protein AB2385_01160 [Symbiobacterium sp.]|uniref:hypothetical protein n=1 Tax=Symbiobacterium sp. TaxID=1971213 RepID=UPI003463CC1F